ncbi:MAG: DNA recombination protein RmuC [Acidobacteriota bacterium]|nr:DNA recombination protein RmuC [Acidobacteriota bacterium]
MLMTLAVLEGLVLIALIVLLRRATGGGAGHPAAQMDALREQLTRTDARSEALDLHVRGALEGIRRDAVAEAHAGRSASDGAFAALRTEVTGSIASLGISLHAGLEGLRGDYTRSAESLRNAVEGIAHRLNGSLADANAGQLNASDALHRTLTELAASNAAQQERLRAGIEERLQRLNEANAAKLEEMRLTVDEKLHATLHSRLTESFGQVTDQLNKVHTGLGEMTRLSEGVEGLSRIFTNVKSRGGFAEVQLGMLLKQMLAPGQYVENETMRPDSQERVEFAIRFPTSAGERLMPIDAKFPRECWERLEAAYESNLPDEIERAGRAFESAIRTQAAKICDKYIHPPRTTPYAIMFLPTEGLYAEVIRREALQAEIQSQCHVTLAGPTTLAAILTSFQMGFHMLALQEKGDEVWKILESAKSEFGKFGKLMDKFEGDFLKIQKTIGEVGVRTRAINRTLRDVSDPSVPATAALEFEDFARPALSLVAASEED